ncbi:MAG: hypothetical protein LBG45_08010 [Dysgonamonadaceae bacterium]|jgi:hypothetical protein|nr:hypothetical protein [Dysgonamonadaceae bacterium]
MKYVNIREEELKNSVATDFFDRFDCDRIVGFIDFAVKPKRPADAIDFNGEYLLWAEAKTGSRDIFAMFTQLVLTAGKARTFDKHLPPPFLGAFDGEKIAFVPYSEIQDIFYQNDFNWNVAPSNRNTKEFKQVYGKIKKAIENEIPFEICLFYFEKDGNELRRFIRDNFIAGKSGTSKIKIDKNNFKNIFNKWTDEVLPSIAVNWDLIKKSGLIAGDFYLADLLSAGNKTLKDKLFVLLQSNYYEIDRHLNEFEIFTSSKIEFKDKQKAHNQFWAKYERPPLEDYWDYILNRRDLLVPPDIRERKGSFFTPKIWVELSQRYIADVLGEDWQGEYYVWDCAAGTGNLLEGLTNKYNIWASTLDKQDVGVMKDRIKNGANLLESHVFQFDFLNDDFSKLPEGLKKIINNPQLRKRLIIYINPPYAEHGNRTTFAGKSEHKAKVSTTSKTHANFQNMVGTATRELYVQFFLNIYKNIPDAKLASFSTPKFITAQNFSKFRVYFKAEFLKGFICKANTFDNVNGHFPIGFFMWNLDKKNSISKIKTDVFNTDADLKHCWKEGEKQFRAINEKIFISDWLRKYYDKGNQTIGYIILPGVDMQQQNGVYITSQPTESDILQHKTAKITIRNLIQTSIYLAIRKCIKPNWLNNRDQFLYPNDGWENDTEFHNDCLTYTLFNTNVSVKESINHWIPFTESEVNARSEFESHFMISFLSGKIIQNAYTDLFEQLEKENPSSKTNWRKGEKREFSPEAQAVFDAGRELWKYYHAQKNIDANAALYDIKEYFQGRNNKGKMNNKSADERYNELIGNLRETLKVLAAKIEPKVYEYEFLKR